MPTPDAYHAAIRSHTRTDPRDLHQDFKKLVSTRVALPAGESAYWAVPRMEGEWRLPRDTETAEESDKLVILPVRDDEYTFNAYMSVVPQPIIMHAEVAYIPRSMPFPMAVAGKNGFNWRQSQRDTDREVLDYEMLLKRYYLHNEDQWRGDINDAWLLKGEKLGLDEVALSVRAFRDSDGFEEHMERYGRRSISMGWYRDSKFPLVAEGLAVLAANLDVAVEFGRQWQEEHPGELLVFKTLYGARTEGTAIFSARGTKSKGVSSEAQVRRKFGAAAGKPIVIQPYKEPDTLAGAGITFRTGDRESIRSVEHIGSKQPGERVVPGGESHFSMIFRSFVIYLPEEKRLVHAGGLWHATDGRIVHGGAHSVAGPLYVDGLPAHGGAQNVRAVRAAEAMLSRYRR